MLDYRDCISLYYQDMSKVAKRLSPNDWEDLLHATIIRILERKNLPQEGNIKAFCTFQVRRQFLDEKLKDPSYVSPQKKKRKTRIEVCSLNQLLPSNEENDGNADWEVPVPPNQIDAIRLKEVMSFILALPERTKKIMLLTIFHDMTQAEAAKVVGCTWSAAQNDVYRTKEKLKELAA